MWANIRQRRIRPCNLYDSCGFEIIEFVIGNAQFGIYLFVVFAEQGGATWFGADVFAYMDGVARVRYLFAEFGVIDPHPEFARLELLAVHYFLYGVYGAEEDSPRYGGFEKLLLGLCEHEVGDVVCNPGKLLLADGGGVYLLPGVVPQLQRHPLLVRHLDKYAG